MIAKLLAFAYLSLTISAHYQDSDCTSYAPVCGADQKTYQNACQCRMAKIKIEKPGVCNRKIQIEWVPRPEPVKRNKVSYHWSHYNPRDIEHKRRAYEASTWDQSLGEALWNQNAWNGGDFGHAYGDMDFNWASHAQFPNLNYNFGSQFGHPLAGYDQSAWGLGAVGLGHGAYEHGAHGHGAYDLGAFGQVGHNLQLHGSAHGLPEISDVMGVSQSHENDWNWQNAMKNASQSWSSQGEQSWSSNAGQLYEGEWDNVDLNNGEWTQVPVVNQSQGEWVYGGDAGTVFAGDFQGNQSTAYGSWQGNQWVPSGDNSVNYQSATETFSAPTIDFNTSDIDLNDVPFPEVLGSGPSDVNFSYPTMPVAPVFDNQPSMPTFPGLGMPVEQLPSIEKVLTPNLDGINFNQLDSKTFNMLTNQWVQTHGSDAWWAGAPSDNSRITLVGDALE